METKEGMVMLRCNKVNVIDFETKKARKDLEKAESNLPYSKYLKELQDPDIELEIHDFLNRFDSTPYHSDFNLKAQALLKEIARRISHSPNTIGSVLRMKKSLLGQFSQLESRLNEGPCE